jgi:hypothetical protein
MITPDTARVYLEQIRELIEATSTDGREAPHLKGYDFERRFAVVCERRGMGVSRAGRGHFDYVVDGLRVQCKCLVPDLNGVVYVQPGSGPACAPGSFDALAIETPVGLHIIPEEDIPRTKTSGLLRSAIHASFLAAYLDAWWVLERGERPAGFVRQLPLWSTNEEDEDGR